MLCCMNYIKFRFVSLVKGWGLSVAAGGFQEHSIGGWGRLAGFRSRGYKVLTSGLFFKLLTLIVMTFYMMFTITQKCV